MEVGYLKVLTKYTCILILVMLIKGFINLNVYSDTNYNIKKFELKYEQLEIAGEFGTYLKPVFNVEEINELVTSYIDDNACTYLDYSIFEPKDNLVSVYLDCGKKENIIYDYSHKEKLEFASLIKDTESFKNSIKKLLNLKYPKFVTEEADILNGIYKLNTNELIGYFYTESYGLTSIKINNNEIKDLLNYEQVYDDVYENEIYTIDPNKPVIAFTFDDGPSTYDLDIIDYLVDSHSTATFFVVGNRIGNFKSSIEKMLEYGMEVGNHSYDHKYLPNLSQSNFIKEITSTNDIYKNLTGKELQLFRPPYGAASSANLRAAEVPSILWSIDTLDWSSRNADKVYAKIMENPRNGDIILMHSLYESTRDAVKMVIPELYKKGFQIVSVSELAKLKGKQIEIGKSYTCFR